MHTRWVLTVFKKKKRITKKGVQYSTGNCVQYSVMSFNGKHIKDVYTCITESLFYSRN